MGDRTPVGNEPPVVEMKSITKRFPGVLANEAVNFACYPGEVHSLLGENGAGKSTLMKILAGLYRADEGEILVQGRPVDITSPREALRLGIGMVHQELRLVQSLSVAENIIIGSDGFGFFYSKKKKAKEVERFASEIGLDIDPGTPVWQLSVGEQQRVEILKILYRGVNLVVLDEPTALLTPQETRNLFQYLRRIAGTGCSIAFVTHKLEEVMAAADRITILRQGRKVTTIPKVGVNVQELARLMIGGLPSSGPGGDRTSPGEAVLELKDVHARGDHKRPVLKGLSFSIAGGEILGLAGVAGNGQRELAEAVAGLRPISQGAILLAGERIDGLSPKAILDRGISYIPEDRMGVGVVPDMSVAENLVLRDYALEEFSGRVFVKKKPRAEHARRLIEAFDIKTHDMNQPVRLLSGGNIQRVILAREISRNPGLLLAVNPTRGLDIGAAEGIHRFLREQKNRGAGILMISEDLDELFKLSDRLAVIFKGRIRGIIKPDRRLLDDIGLMMGGAGPETDS
ncbi:MAG: ABC transporter ATP-binding protein [Thermodesulfobacteriota bacterium]